jgi:hypothetical protein
MADGSLSAEAEQRMLAAMSRDTDLTARVERARAVRLELGLLADPPVPRGLLRRLWQIPAERPRPRHMGMLWMPAGVLATAVVAAFSINIFLGQQDADVATMDEEQVAAVQDFAIAVSYLQKSMVMAQNEINEAVGSGVVGALAASSGMIDRTENSGSEGDWENDD